MKIKDRHRKGLSFLVAAGLTLSCIAMPPVRACAQEAQTTPKETLDAGETVLPEEESKPEFDWELEETEPTEDVIPPDATLVQISLKELPEIREYVLGQTFDPTGLVVQAHYDNGMTEQIPSGYSCTTPDINTIGKHDVTVSYKGMTASFYITVVNKAVLEYQFVAPTKTEYIQGEEFDITGLDMTFLYNDGSTEKPSVTYTAPDMTKIGEQEVMFQWGTYTEKFTINIAIPGLDRIEISGFWRSRYKTGEELEFTGMVIAAVYADGRQEAIKDFTVSGYEPYSEGKQEVALSYGGKRAVFTVIVENNNPYLCVGGDGCPAGAMMDLDFHQWYHEGIDYVVSKGIMKGTSDRTFTPNGNTTRAMIVTILYRLEGEPSIEDSALFEDVAKDTWYSKAVAWASKTGVVAGYGDGRFGPNDTITREQLAAMLYRYANYMELDTTVRADMSSLPDVKNISSWAKDAMAWTYAENMIVGIPQASHVTMIEPRGNATRAQVAAIIFRFCEKVLPYRS